MEAVVNLSMNTNARIERRLGASPRKMQAQKGFSLIEVMIVMIIFGVLAAIAMPAFKQWRAHSAVNDAAASVMAHMKQARNLAMAESRSVAVLFGVTSYTFDANTSGTCTVCKAITIDLEQFSGNLTLSNNFSGNDCIFKSDGSLSGNSGKVTVSDSGDSSYSRDISVNLIGRAQ